MYRAPIEHYMQLLNRWANKHSTYDLQTMEQILNAIATFVQSGLVPTNQMGDKEGVAYDEKTHQVTVPKCYHDVYKTICENSYASLALPSEFGGGGGPWVLHHMASEMLASGNLALSTCPMLTNGAAQTLIENGTDELKDQYAQKMISGEYAATMCLTEPQCGTDLGLIKTKAVPQDDHYVLTGSKIWITFGEHDLTDNILHLVLAKAPDAPEGTKGISMFLVPKVLPDGSKNTVSCGGLEHKMGQNASPTAVLNFDNAQGWLIGELHSGLKAMFQMMNPARIGVGVQALSLAEIAYQQALSFASTRRQSRSLDPKLSDKEAAADIILVHPDIRRMLMTIEVTNYAMRTLVAFCSYQLDEDNDAFAGILTPIVKSYVTEQSMHNVSLAMQVMGGMGYVTDGLCEQYYRDGRITMIYEGTNGIQALDLLGRKIAKDGGQSLIKLVGTLNIDKQYRQLLDQANEHLLKNAQDQIEMASIASNYLNLLALVIQSGLLADDDKMPSELKVFFDDYIMPEASLYLARIVKGKSAMMQHSGYAQILQDAHR